MQDLRVLDKSSVHFFFWIDFASAQISRGRGNSLLMRAR